MADAARKALDCSDSIDILADVLEKGAGGAV
jgi:hypothetical protein